MKTYFGLGWMTSGKNWRKSFKSAGALNLFDDYLGRISHFSSAEAGSTPDVSELKNKKIWLCDTSPATKAVSSEDLAKKVSQLLDSGSKELLILIGGADGFTTEDILRFKPDFRWNFGPMTLPHELAAAVASEQLYRAWTIIHRLPYHSGH